MNYTTLQTEHKAWLEERFPNQKPIFPAVGMLEEAGELIHVLLKMAQKQIWGKEQWRGNDEIRDQLIDAIGDSAIFTCSLCNSIGWSFQGLIDSVKSQPVTNTPVLSFKETVKLAEAAISVIRACESPVAYSHVRVFLSHLFEIARAAHVDFDSAIEVTWNIVKTRTKSAMMRPAIVCVLNGDGLASDYPIEMVDAMNGKIIFHPDWSDPELNLRKIDLADEVFVFGEHDHEKAIEYARSLNKPIRSFSSCE